MKGILDSITMMFTAELVKASILLALLCTSGAVGLFFYLSRATSKTCLRLWALSWMFYGVSLASTFTLVDSPTMKALVAVERACIGLSALFLFYGTSHQTRTLRWQKEISFAAGLIAIWSAVAVYTLQDSIWGKIPVFALLAGASVFAGVVSARDSKMNQGAQILRTAFILWAVHAASMPFLGASNGVIALGFFTAGLFPLVITAGVVIQRETSIAEQKYRGVFDSANDAIFLVDLYSMKIHEANGAACRLAQLDQEDLVNKSLAQLCPDLNKKGTADLDNRKTLDAVFRRYNQFSIVRPGGTQIQCEGDASLLQWRNAPVLQINMREVDKRAKVGEQMRRGEKLSALGQLIAGVAHELNNPLAVVMGYTQLISKQKELDAKTRGNVLTVLHESERAAKIVRNLLTFVRPCEPQKVAFDANRLLSNVLDIREADLRAHRITLERRLAPKLPITKADPHQVEQVVTNLITNAIHAMADHAMERKLTVATEENGFSIRIIVADTGPGIPKTVVDKIFDPFFTTKPPGKGTGLGLTICNSIVDEHRGKIWVETAVNKGCKFFVELPLIACEEEVKPLVPLPSVNPLTTNENAAKHRLLLVDDEPGILGVLQEVLSENGYKVETANNGAEAIDQIKRTRYDLIISDLCMPQIDGKELYRQVLKTDPEMARRMTFLTGDTVSNVSREFLESTGSRWFSKPFSVTDIEQYVREFLSKGPSAPATANGNEAAPIEQDSSISQFAS